MRERTGWLLALLLTAVLVPTGALLWFMYEASTSQTTMAVQSAQEAYRAHLRVIRSRLAEEWEMRSAVLDARPGENPSARYARIMASGQVDAVVLLDGDGRTIPTTGGSGESADLVAMFLDNNMLHTGRGG